MNTLNEGGKGGLGMVLAVLGCVLGLLGVFVGVQGQKAAKQASVDVQDLTMQLSSLSSEDQRLAYAIKDLEQRTKDAVIALEAKMPKTPPPSTNRVSKATGGAGGTAKTTSNQPGMYSIKPGDTLGKVAKEHGITVEAIEKANPGIDSRRLKIGQQIKIP